MQGSKESTGTEEDDSTSEEEAEPTDVEVPIESQNEEADAKPATANETEAGAEISALVNYIQPVHFSSFETATSKLFDLGI